MIAADSQLDQIKVYYQQLLDIISRSRQIVAPTAECPGAGSSIITIGPPYQTYRVNHNCPRCNAERQYLMNWVKSTTDDTKETLVKAIAMWIDTEHIWSYGDNIFQESIALKDRVDHWLMIID